MTVILADVNHANEWPEAVVCIALIALAAFVVWCITR